MPIYVYAHKDRTHFRLFSAVVNTNPKQYDMSYRFQKRHKERNHVKISGLTVFLSLEASIWRGKKKKINL